MSDPAPTERKNSLLGSFPPAFWLANVMELVERGAYYCMIALLAVYLRASVDEGGLGFQEDEVGLLLSVVYAAAYVVPILGGALADRYGYRRMLLVAFSLLAAGYFLSGHLTSYWVLFTTLLIMATGSGLFKPIIFGTVARTTDDRNSTLGFGVCYWMINLGALIGPLVAGYLREFSWRHVFIASALYCALMLLLTIYPFRDPPRPESTKSLGEVLGGAALVLSDARFMLLIFVYSCFWILQFQMLGTVLWYLRDFIDRSPVNEFFATIGIPFDFGAEHLVAFNAATIVVVQIVVIWVAGKRAPLPTMVAGSLIGAAGFLILASSQHAWIFVLGIVVASIGQITCYLKYFSYVGLTAPEDKKALYMGYAFLYGVVGSLFGSNLGGETYHRILSPLRGQEGVEVTLGIYWLAFAVLGVGTAILFWVYHKLFREDTPATRARARAVTFAVYGLLVIGAGAILYLVWSKTGAIPIKTWIQGGIMGVVGAGGLLIMLGGGRREEA